MKKLFSMDMKMSKIIKIIGIIIGIELLILINIYIIYLISYKKLDYYNKNLNSVVEVYSYTEDITNFGTAWFIDENVLVTNFHVIGYDINSEIQLYDNVCVRFYDEKDYTTVSILNYDSVLDIAFLKYDNEHKSKCFKKTFDYFASQDCHCIGNFNNYGLSYKKGKISLDEIKLEYNDKISSFIQCDISIGPGDSGAPLFNNANKLVGMVSFRTKSNSGNVEQGYSYVIPSTVIYNYYNSLNYKSNIT